MKLLILLVFLSPTLFADYGVEKTYHLTYQTATKKCALTVLVLTSGKIKTERLCFNLIK